MNDQTSKGELIERAINRETAGAIALSNAAGGLSFQSMMEVFEFAKLMALSRQAVPPHLRDNPGMCLAVAVQATEWRMSPFAVANKSYVVNDRIAWESQLIHAVIEQRAPLVGRIRHSFEGEGDDRVCVVTAQVKGEVEPVVYRSPPIKQISPKNSPLWKTKPDLQLYYNAVRDFARTYFPDVILGVYAEDELDGTFIGAERAKDVSPGLHERLAAAAPTGEGFKPDTVETAIGEATETAAGEPEAADPSSDTPKRKRGRPKAPKPDSPQPGKALTANEPSPSPSPSTEQPVAGPTPQAVEGGGEPKTAAEYVAYAEAWIERATNPDDIEARYDGERDARDTLQVAVSDRNRLSKAVAEKVAKLRGE